MSFNRETEWTEIIGWSRPPYGFSEPEQLLSAFFAASSVGLSIVDTHLNYQAINQSLADMNGFSIEAHLGKSMRDILGSAAEPAEPILRNVLLTGKPVTNVPLTLKLPTRTEVGHWVVHYFPMNDASGNVTRIGVVVVEVTEQKKLEEKLASLTSEVEREKAWRHVLLEITTILSSTEDLRGLFPSISASIRTVMQQDWSSLSILEKSTSLVHTCVADCALDRELVDNQPVVSQADSFWEKLVEEKRPRIFYRADLATVDSTFFASLLQAGIESVCCLPFITPKGSVGSFNLTSIKTEAFQSEDLYFLKLIGLQLAGALDRSLVHHDTKSRDATRTQPVQLQPETHNEPEFTGIVGTSPAVRRVLDQAKTVARSDATVLILGETGTGKDVIARAIHAMSLRKNGPFIKLNCAAIPHGLVESELFGHEKGAFTGAVSKKAGRLELANHGTLFLDEIGDLPLELQPKLLRVLQDQEFERLGGNRTIRVDVRLLAATNRDLSSGVVQRTFRPDLYYRLNVFPILMPPLSARREDIPSLVRHFTRQHALRMKKTIETIPVETMSALETWDWPGNIRELENLIERSVILSDGPVLNVPLTELRTHQTTPALTLEGMGREYILRALSECDGEIDGRQGAASRLGINSSTLHSMIQRMKITRNDYRN